MKANAVHLRLSRLLLVGFIAVAAALTVLQTANAGPPSPDVPDQIQVDTVNNKVFLVGHAVGVQIYQCNGTAWTFVAPRANLFDDNGHLIISHFGGRPGRRTTGARSWASSRRA